MTLTEDHTDIAYRAAVSKLRHILSPKSPTQKFYSSSNQIPSFTSSTNQNPAFNILPNCPIESTPYANYSITNTSEAPCLEELLKFMNKQNSYIVQLENYSKNNEEELKWVLENVREIIYENEGFLDRDKEKSSILKNNNVHEEEIRFMDDKLSETKRSLRLAQEEVLELRRKLDENEMILEKSGSHLVKIEKLTRERDDVEDSLKKLQKLNSELQEKEGESARRVQKSLEILDQIRIEKSKVEEERDSYRSKLNSLEIRFKDLSEDSSRNLSDKIAAERNMTKYKKEAEDLHAELNSEVEFVAKLKFDFERQKRVEAELRREIQHKLSFIEDIRQEIQIKSTHVQSELSHALQLKSATEQELISTKLQLEKCERDSRQESLRLQTELRIVQKKLEDTHEDLLKCQDVIFKQSENIVKLQKVENSKLWQQSYQSNKKISEGSSSARDRDFEFILQSLEEKYRGETKELEEIISTQINIINKLKEECKGLTQRLEETVTEFKGQKDVFEKETRKMRERTSDLDSKNQFYIKSHEQITKRLYALEDEDKNRADKIFKLLSKQGELLKENQRLTNEISELKSKLSIGQLNLNS